MFPDFCVSSILTIINYGVNITKALSDAEEVLFKNYHQALPLIGKISQISSKMLRPMIHLQFLSNQGMVEKFT